MSDQKLTKSDHDTLIRLDEKFDIFSSQVIKEVQEVKNNVRARNAELFNRIEDLERWKGNLQSNFKFMLAVASGIGGAIGVVATILLILSHFIKI